MKFPTLFKKTSTGAIQFWDIETGEYDHIAWINTTYGQVGTDSPQKTTDYIENGKNIGKKNETTPIQQADKEAEAKWTKRKKAGYVESVKAAEAEELDELIKGGIAPMLAHKFSEHGHKIKYPCYVQPKMDGIRCIAMIDKNGKCTLWSRTRKQITSVPHIIKEIEAMNLAYGVLDGELYNHQYKSNFEHIVHLVRQEEPDPQHTDVEYHIYDMITEDTFEHRIGWIKSIWSMLMLNGPTHLKLVQTEEVKTEEEAIEWYNAFKEMGYEGAMLRNSAGLYVNKRSYDLLKVKEFQDDEFKIIGIEEGRGKLSGHVGSFLCETSTGKPFSAKAKGSTEMLKTYFQDHSTWQGKKLTVQYQGLTGKEGVPRFPVGKAIRDYE